MDLHWYLEVATRADSDGIFSKENIHTLWFDYVDTNQRLGCQVIDNVVFTLNHGSPGFTLTIKALDEHGDLGIVAGIMFSVTDPCHRHRCGHLRYRSIRVLREKEFPIDQAGSCSSISAYIMYGSGG